MNFIIYAPFDSGNQFFHSVLVFFRFHLTLGLHLGHLVLALHLNHPSLGALGYGCSEGSNIELCALHTPFLSW